MGNPATKSILVAGFVTNGAIVGSFVSAMTIHAISHGNACLFEEPIQLGYFTMAGFAFSTAFQMGLVAEEDVAGQLVDSLPRNGSLGFMEFSQLCDLRRFFPDALMACHAFGCSWNAHELTGILVFVAVFAFQTHGEMGLVAVGNRLLGSLGDLGSLKKSQEQK